MNYEEIILPYLLSIALVLYEAYIGSICCKIMSIANVVIVLNELINLRLTNPIFDEEFLFNSIVVTTTINVLSIIIPGMCGDAYYNYVYEYV